LSLGTPSFFSVRAVSLPLAVGHFTVAEPRININRKFYVNSLASVVAGGFPMVVQIWPCLAMGDKKHFDRSNINANDDILLMA